FTSVTVRPHPRPTLFPYTTLFRSKGQSEAARALGLSEGQRLRLIVLPQALRVIIPPLTSQYLNLVKNSSLALAIAYPDLWQVMKDRKSTRLNSSHVKISYAVFCLK